MLDFKEFQQFVENHLVEYLPTEYKNASLVIHKVQKNNGLVLTGLTVLPIGHNIAPTIYLDSYFENYQNGRALYDILGDICTVACVHMNPNNFGSIETDFQNFDYVKDRVIMVAVNRQKNEEFLRQVPHHNFEDLALIYKVLITEASPDIATITIYNQHMSFWNTSESELYDLAMKNTKELLPVKVQRIMPGEMYMISNMPHINGAAAILYDDVLSEISERVESDLFIIPSSVHECLAVSVEYTDAKELAEMVETVNEEKLEENEILSNNVYRFNAKDKTIALANTSVEELGLLNNNECAKAAMHPRRCR